MLRGRLSGCRLLRGRLFGRRLVRRRLFRSRLVRRRLFRRRRWRCGLLGNRRGLDLLVVGQGRRPDLGQTAARRALARPHWCFLHRRRRRLARPRTFIFLANILLAVLDLLDLPSLASGPRDDLVGPLPSHDVEDDHGRRLQPPDVSSLAHAPDLVPRQEQRVPPTETRQAPRLATQGFRHEI